MVSTTSLWRPGLFAATGVGFKDDPHLTDGQHLRWHLAHQLGLPFQSRDEKRGVFRIHHRVRGASTIASLQLIGGGGGASFPVFDEAVSSSEAGLIAGADTLAFWKRPSLDLALLFLRLRGILDANPAALWSWREMEEDGVLRRYVAEVTARLAPDFVANTMLQERTDACAVDLAFSGIGPGAPSPAGRRFLLVDGLDRGGRIVAQDWVGQEPSGAPRAVARLRGAGFASVRWTRQAGQPAVTRSQTRWVLSEDYCHGEGWLEAGEVRFVADPGFHTPSAVKEHYLPFRAPFDPDVVADALANFLLVTPEIKALFEPGQDVYRMATQSAGFGEAGDARAGTMRASVLQSLVASGVDPVMARVLGLYGFIDPATADSKRRGDIMIEAELPFFEPGNLAAIDGRLQGLLPEQDGAFFRNAAESLKERRLCALVLAVDIAPRQPVPMPEILGTLASAAVLPAQSGSPVPEILVQTRTEVKVDPLEVRPELTPVAYLVERQVLDGAFVNVSETLGEPDILDKIGLLPAVYFPARRDAAAAEPLRIADDFVLTELGPSSVRYRIGAFDVFGRPSEAALGDPNAVEPPVLPPPPPLNPAARIVAEAGRLVLEVDFAVNGTTPPLEAEWQRLEATVHLLPPLDPVTPDPRPAGEVTWTGEVAARRLAAEVLPGNVLAPTLAPSCVTLAWTPGLGATEVAETVCAPLYPPPAPQLLAVDPPSASFAGTGLRSYRLRVTVGSETGLPPAAYRWAARLVIVGRDPLHGTRRDSPEACVAADWMVHPPPPAVVAPVTSAVPLSSYPDGHGESWYDLDLGAWGLGEGERVNVYMTRLRRLGDAADLVSDGVLQDRTSFEAAVRASRRPFELVNREPVQVSPGAPFYRIPVPGHLRETYVLAVLGTNAYLQERRWAEAGVALFATPERRAGPRLSFLRLTRAAPGVAALEFAADFAEAPDAATPPRVQLFRRDLSAGGRLSYVGEASGTPVPVVPGSEAAARVRFALDDAGQADWHAYEYEAQLLHHDGAGYVRSREVAQVVARAGWDGSSAPVGAADAIEVAPGAPSGLVVTCEFDCGEFEVVLTRSLGGIVASRFAGRIRSGRVFGLDPAIHRPGTGQPRRDGAVTA